MSKVDSFICAISYLRFAHFPSNLLKSLDRGVAKSVVLALQIIDFKGITKMTEPWNLKCCSNELRTPLWAA
jgi:hypothetical protein